MSLETIVIVAGFCVVILISLGVEILSVFPVRRLLWYLAIFRVLSGVLIFWTDFPEYLSPPDRLPNHPLKN